MSSPSRQIFLGGIPIGGGAPVSVQSMTNTDTRNIEATLAQIHALADAGCEIIRVAAPDMAAARAVAAIVDASPLPVIADIHFDYRLAITSLENGAAGIRINPGNIGSKEKIFKVVDAAKAHGAVIRVGVNSGSLEKSLLERFGHPTPEGLAMSAVNNARLLESRGFENIKISLKSSSAADTIAACRALRKMSDYPLHIGVTEAGTLMRGAIKSAVGLGILLHEGIGDTMRVSLTADPLEEVKVAYEILRALGLRQRGPEIISCPTCGRTEIDLISLANQVEKMLAGCSLPLKVAVMGCVVNGPGEAREADIGIAGGRDKGIIFRQGEVIGSVKGQAALMDAFSAELRKMLAEKNPNNN